MTDFKARIANFFKKKKDPKITQQTSSFDNPDPNRYETIEFDNEDQRSKNNRLNK